MKAKLFTVTEDARRAILAGEVRVALVVFADNDLPACDGARWHIATQVFCDRALEDSVAEILDHFYPYSRPEEPLVGYQRLWQGGPVSPDDEEVKEKVSLMVDMLAPIATFVEDAA